MALATTNSGKYGKEGWDELWGENGLWSCRTFSSVRGVSFFVIYRRRNRIKEGRKGRRRLLLFKAVRRGVSMEGEGNGEVRG